MPRRSVRKEKNEYFQSRERAGLTREAASEKMDFISDDRIERIESDRSEPHPEEVLAMAAAYNDPLLPNWYCTSECPIGKRFVPKITDTELSRIVLEIMDSTTRLNSFKDRLVSITADGVISKEERPDFEEICSQLERISAASSTLKYWMEFKLD